MRLNLVLLATAVALLSSEGLAASTEDARNLLSFGNIPEERSNTIATTTATTTIPITKRKRPVSVSGSSGDGGSSSEASGSDDWLASMNASDLADTSSFDLSDLLSSADSASGSSSKTPSSTNTETPAPMTAASTSSSDDRSECPKGWFGLTWSWLKDTFGDDDKCALRRRLRLESE